MTSSGRQPSTMKFSEITSNQSIHGCRRECGGNGDGASQLQNQVMENQSDSLFNQYQLPGQRGAPYGAGARSLQAQRFGFTPTSSRPSGLPAVQSCAVEVITNPWPLPEFCPLQ